MSPVNRSRKTWNTGRLRPKKFVTVCYPPKISRQNQVSKHKGYGILISRLTLLRCRGPNNVFPSLPTPYARQIGGHRVDKVSRGAKHMPSDHVKGPQLFGFQPGASSFSYHPTKCSLTFLRLISPPFPVIFTLMYRARHHFRLRPRSSRHYCRISSLSLVSRP